MSVFRIRMLQAGHGDCLLIEYGADEYHLHRFLVDGGTAGTFTRLEPIVADRHLELVVVTHIDADHIAGALRFFAEPPAIVDDVWFNGYCHLPGSDVEDFGPAQGEALTAALRDIWPWNEAFDGGAVMVPDRGPLVTHALPGGMQLTVLSPSAARLADLRPVWWVTCRQHGLDPSSTPPPPEVAADIESFGPPDVVALAATPFEADGSRANGSSIALLAEYDGKRALLAGDAFASELIAGIDRLVGPDRVLAIDAFKLPHHGSKANVSAELLARLPCPRYLVSTNGAYFKHPDAVAMARVIVHGDDPELIFNARTRHNEMWSSSVLQTRHGYRARYPEDDAGEVSVDL